MNGHKTPTYIYEIIVGMGEQKKGKWTRDLAKEEGLICANCVHFYPAKLEDFPCNRDDILKIYWDKKKEEWVYDFDIFFDEEKEKWMCNIYSENKEKAGKKG